MYAVGATNSSAKCRHNTAQEKTTEPQTGGCHAITHPMPLHETKATTTTTTTPSPHTHHCSFFLSHELMITTCRTSRAHPLCLTSLYLSKPPAFLSVRLRLFFPCQYSSRHLLHKKEGIALSSTTTTTKCRPRSHLGKVNDGGVEEEGEREVHCECELEVVSWRERRVKASISINAGIDSVWNALTDYEHLADFIPNLVWR